jgi:hypothetical protein
LAMADRRRYHIIAPAGRSYGSARRLDQRAQSMSATEYACNDGLGLDFLTALSRAICSRLMSDPQSGRHAAQKVTMAPVRS